MRLIVDRSQRQLTCESETGSQTFSLDSPEAFEMISQCWIEVGWSQKFSYTFTWLGRPIIQLPEDMLLIQEVLYRVKPDVVVETGVAHGGSLIFYASLCQALGKGRVIGVDIEIRPHNRIAIENHSLSNFITLIQGSSTDPATIEAVQQLIRPEETVLVLLDSCHTREHVLAELAAYAPLVTPGSYIVATDGVMEQVAQTPRGKPNWVWDNPRQAALEFVKQQSDFHLEEPPFLFNESPLTQRVTAWPSAFLRRAG